LQTPQGCPFAEVAPDATITGHFEQCLRFAFIGGQYEWLARFCAPRHIEDMELAIHRDDKARELWSPTRLSREAASLAPHPMFPSPLL
jgi:hypothetical protein